MERVTLILLRDQTNQMADLTRDRDVMSRVATNHLIYAGINYLISIDRTPESTCAVPDGHRVRILYD